MGKIEFKTCGVVELEDYGDVVDELEQTVRPIIHMASEFPYRLSEESEDDDLLSVHESLRLALTHWDNILTCVFQESEKKPEAVAA